MKSKRKAQSSTAPIVSRQGDSDSDGDGDMPPVTVPPRQRGRPRKNTDELAQPRKGAIRAMARPIKPVSTDKGTKDFKIDVFVWVDRDPLLVRGATKRGNKTVAQEPWKMGPFSISGDTTWGKFLTHVATTVKLPSDSELASDSMQWRWRHEKQSLPLTSETGFESMVKQIRASRIGDADLLIVTMEKPLPKYGDGELPVSQHDSNFCTY